MKQKPIQMLMVDARCLTSNLDRMGYREMGALVSQASTEDEAHKKLKSKAIDVVVLNYDDTEIDMGQICRQIKSQKTLAAIPVIATTVQSRADLRNRAIKDGVDLVVELPIPRSAFIEQIKQLLAQKTREDKRLMLNLPKAVVTWNGKSFELQVADLSKTGVLLTCEENFPLEQKVGLSIKLPDVKKPVSIQGVVVRQVAAGGKNSQSGVGIRFDSFADSDAESNLFKFLEAAKLEVDTLRYYL